MKTKIILLIIFSLCGIMPCASQEQESVFPTSDAIWNIQLYTDGYYATEYKYGLFGDTIINSKQYSKLYLLNDTLLHIDENDIYIGGFRQENKKVWFLLNDYGYYDYEEYILYDFGKNIGETVEWTNPLVYMGAYYTGGEPGVYGYYDEKIIREVLDVEESGYGRIFHLSDYFLWGTDVNSKWIEGIGSTIGLFWDFMVYPMGYNSIRYKLACMKLGDEWVYLDNGECDYCFIEQEPRNIEVPHGETCFIFSNYLTKQIEIHTSSLMQNYTFELLNLQGQVIQTEKITSAHHFFSYAGRQGVFLYRIVENGRVMQTGKLIL